MALNKPLTIKEAFGEENVLSDIEAKKPFLILKEEKEQDATFLCICRDKDWGEEHYITWDRENTRKELMSNETLKPITAPVTPCIIIDADKNDHSAYIVNNIAGYDGPEKFPIIISKENFERSQKEAWELQKEIYQDIKKESPFKALKYLTEHPEFQKVIDNEEKIVSLNDNKNKVPDEMAI